MTNAAHLLRLLDAPSVGPRRVLKLLRESGDVDSAVRELLDSPSTAESIRAFLVNTPIDEYWNSLLKTHEIGGDFKLWNDADYPQNLKLWESHPPILFFKGDLSKLQRRSLALVGRIDPSPEGVLAAERFARKCAENQIQVISGLAKGIDAASHRAALAEPNGLTYSVLGHGIDHAFPRENAELYRAIPKQGALISQFRTGVGPQKWTFPARNEVMCTLALGTVIIEAKAKCGSLIQADFSFKHGRPVFILGRNIRSEDSSWADELVERGAHVIEHFDQVLEIVSLQEDFVRPNDSGSTTMSLFDIGVSELKSLPEPSAALFDLDGVIVDTRDATARALANIASRRLGITIDPESVRVGAKPHEVLAELGVKDAYSVYKSEYDGEFALALGEVKVFDEVVTAIQMLKSVGVRIAAVTAQPRRRIELILPRAVRDVFEKIFTYNETKGKKDVGITLALAQLKVANKHAVFIGDQSTDLEAARKTGVKGIGVLWGFSSEEQLRKWPSDLLVSEPSDLESGILDVLSSS
jgi:DNA protecting protein DprA